MATSEEKRVETLEKSLDSLMDTLKKLEKAVDKAFNPQAVVDFSHEASNAVKDVTEAWSDFQGSIENEAMDAALETLEELVEVLSGEMSVQNFVDSITLVETALLGLAAAFSVEKAVSRISTARAALEKFTTSVKSLSATSIAGKIAEVVLLTEGNLKDLREAMVMEEIFGPLGTTIAGAAAGVGGAVLAVSKFITMLEEGFSWVNEAMMVLGIGIAAVGAIILGVHVGIAAAVAAAVAVIATGVILVKEHWEEIKAFLSGAAAWFSETVIGPVSEAIGPLWEGITVMASEAWAFIQELWSPVAEWFSENVIAPLAEYFSAVGQTVRDVFEGVKIIAQAVGKLISENVIDPLVDRFSQACRSVSGFFSGLWEGICAKWNDATSRIGSKIASLIELFAWLGSGLIEILQMVGGGIAQYLEKPVQAVANFIRGVINQLIGLVEGMLNGIIKGINNFLLGFSLVTALAARYIGTDWGGVALLPSVSLPRLANGAVIPPNRQFAAILGDQRSGVNIEAPLSTIEQALQNVMERNGGMAREIHITVESVLDGKVVARNTVKHINDMTRMAGKPVLLI